jgi:hypothetical protein
MTYCSICTTDPCVSPRLCAAQRAEAGRKASVEAEDREEEQRKTQADVLLELASGATLFHTPEREGFVDVLVGDHRETHRICGAAFRRWLRHQYYKSKKRGCNSDALKVAVETLDAKAIFESESRDVHVRVASYYDDIYIDLGDNGWKAIKVTKAGWSIVANPPLRFQRAPSMRRFRCQRRAALSNCYGHSATFPTMALLCLLPCCSRDCGQTQTIQCLRSLASKALARVRWRASSLD